MGDTPIKVRSQKVASLTSKVRNHPASPFDGEDSQDEVVTAILEQEIARLDDEEHLSAEAQQEQARLKKKLGLEGDAEELAEGEELSEKERKQAELIEKMKGRQQKGRNVPNFSDIF